MKTDSNGKQGSRMCGNGTQGSARRRWKWVSISTLLSLFIFLILVSTAVIIVAAALFLFSTGIVDVTTSLKPQMLILVPMLASIVLGTIISAVCVPYFLKPLHRLVKAMNQLAADNAYEAYQSALQSFNATAASAETAFTSSYNSLETAKLSADHATSELELAQLEEELGETSVKAGVDGTVTAVYATVGSPAAGLLFVIEDIDNLEVETSVKEYDIGNVKVGMPVTIRSDATGDEIYQGTITSIAPTSNKNAQGDTDTTGDIEFATKVKVDSEDTGLRIGMSVRLNYILEEQKDVLAVPYDAVYTNAQGQNCIMVLTEQESGNYLLEELPVTPGMENDLNIAVEGDGVKEGLRVVNEPDQYQALLGQEVVLTERQQTMSMYGVPMN